MQQRSEETRHNVLESALVLFSKNGYDGTSVADICELAGISKGAFYHHFPSKQSVFLALLERWLGDLDNQLKSARVGAGDSSQAIIQMAAMARGVFEVADGRMPMFLEFWTQASRDPSIWQATIAPYRRYTQFFSEIFKAGIQDGSIGETDPDIAARLVVALAVGLLLQGVLDPSGMDWGLTASKGVEIIMKGLKENQ